MSETTHMSLLEFVRELLSNVQLRDWFAKDPQAALNHYGLQDLSAADVRDAMTLAQDNHTAAWHGDAGHGSQHRWSGNDDRDDDSGHHDGGGRHDDGGHHDNGGHHDDGGQHAQSVDQINRYVTNNWIDHRETVVDNSVHQNVDTHGGDFDQTIGIHSTTAFGDGAVAAGGNIDHSTVTTGDGNQVGNGNIRGDGNVVGDNNHVLNGDGNTTAFGSGSANSANIHDVNVGHGGALSVGGNATASNTNTDSHDSSTVTHTTTTDYDHSFNTDVDSASNSYNDTHNTADTDSHNTTHNDLGSHNDLNVHI